jgi:DNA repair protein RadD
MLNLREYQLEANRDVWRAFKEVQAVLLQAPTGAGKTISGAHLIAMRREHAKERVLVLAHRREIVAQTLTKLADADIEAGIIMADHAPMQWLDVQVASIDTLWARRKQQGFPEAGLLVVDEVHRAGSDRHLAIIDHYKQSGAKVLGLTATPIRTDGFGLGNIFDRMVRTPDMPWLIDHGYLVPVDYRVGIIPDVTGVKLTAGEYNKAQLEAVMNATVLIGDIVDNWKRYACDRRTMVFASGVAHSIHLMNQFKAAGVKAVHIDGETDNSIRDRVFAEINSGETQVICNAMVYVEGTDIPCIDCIVDAAPSKSIIKYLQSGGRGMRPFTGKRNLQYHDHSGNVYRHGRLELPRDWELAKGKEQVEHLDEQRKKTEKVQITCQQCGFMHNKPICPRCGIPPELKGMAKDFIPAVLVEMTQWEYEKATKEKREKKAEPTHAEKQEFYSGMLFLARERGYKDGWAANGYREHFGIWPRGLVESPREPSYAVKQFDKHKRIAWAKSKHNERNQPQVPA